MTQSLLLTTVVFPLLLGVILAALVHFTRLKVSLLSLAAMVAMMLVYYLLEGMPPFPPVSSKHKIAFLIVLVGVVGVVLGLRRGVPMWPFALGIGLASLGWIGQRKISADPLQAEILLALLPIVGLTIASAAPRAHRQDLFVWPSALLCLCIGGALVSVLGGYIGLGQMLGATAALTGGMLAVHFVLTKLLRRSDADLLAEGVTWVLLTSATVLLISIAVFASKLSVPAFAVLCLIYLTPFAASRFMGRAGWYTPFLVGVFSFVPALVAIGIAGLGAA